MNSENPYLNNPLHGLSTETVLTELVQYYGWDILAAYVELNCFKKNPTIESSLRFLKKTPWAREKLESFYMYQYKSLPRASNYEFEKPPRERIVPEEDKPGEPQKLSVEDAKKLKQQKMENYERRQKEGGARKGKGSYNSGSYSKSSKPKRKGKVDAKTGVLNPWAR